MSSLLIAIVITLADQATKQIVRYSFGLGESRPIIPGFFDLTYVRNQGAAWGMFRDHGVVLIIISIIMLALMLRFRGSLFVSGWEHKISFGLLLGGIIGNLLDRIRLLYVTDFLDFYIGSYHWPAFNIADSSICIGVGFYMLSAFWLNSHPLHESGKSRQD